MILGVICYLVYGCLGYYAVNPIISGETAFKALRIFDRNTRIAARVSLILFWPMWVVGLFLYGCYAGFKKLFKGFLQ